MFWTIPILYFRTWPPTTLQKIYWPSYMSRIPPSSIHNLLLCTTSIVEPTVTRSSHLVDWGVALSWSNTANWKITKILVFFGIKKFIQNFRFSEFFLKLFGPSLVLHKLKWKPILNGNNIHSRLNFKRFHKTSYIFVSNMTEFPDFFDCHFLNIFYILKQIKPFLQLGTQWR